MGQQRVHLGQVHSKHFTAGCLDPAHLAQVSAHALPLGQHKVQLFLQRIISLRLLMDFSPFASRCPPADGGASRAAAQPDAHCPSACQGPCPPAWVPPSLVQESQARAGQGRLTFRRQVPTSFRCESSGCSSTWFTTGFTLACASRSSTCCRLKLLTPI